MSSIISASDFIGVYKISQQSFTTNELTAYISQMQDEMLAPLFGAELYRLFLGDLNGSGVPQSARFVKVYEPFIEEVSSGTLSSFYVGNPANPYFPFGDPRSRKAQTVQSFGIKDMLCGFIYFEFLRNQTFKSTPAGNRVPNQEVSGMPSSGGNSSRIERAYNRAVQSYQAIQWLMSESEESANYPEFNGDQTRTIHMGGAV